MHLGQKRNDHSGVATLLSGKSAGPCLYFMMHRRVRTSHPHWDVFARI